MHADLQFIFTFTGALTAALVCGLATRRIGLSPIVGYLLAGIVVGPNTPGFVADENLSLQMAEIGVILLMFGVGLQFHVRELLAVRRIAIPGALVQIGVATALGALAMKSLGWSWNAGVVFGLAISVASTVVLIRVLTDHGALNTKSGHIAVGWLVVEDIFTVVALVLLPALAGGGLLSGSLFGNIGLALLKLCALTLLVLASGRFVIPRVLSYTARSGSRELFLLAILVLALGVGVGSAKLFGASMALGAFLAGLAVGQSEFSNRAASEALPFRDAFAVIFFVSVGMLFDASRLLADWPLILAATLIVILGKSLAALLVVRLLGFPFSTGISVAVALAQIGEFSFILASLGRDLNMVPEAAQNVLVATAIISITINPLLYKATPKLIALVDDHPILRRWLNPAQPVESKSKEAQRHSGPRAIVIGYGPVGRSARRLLEKNGVRTIVVDLNLDTVRSLRDEDMDAVYGDAGKMETLVNAGITDADYLVLTSSLTSHASETIRMARELRPEILILVRATYEAEAEALERAGADRVVASESEVARTMSEYVLHSLNAKTPGAT